MNVFLNPLTLMICNFNVFSENTNIDYHNSHRYCHIDDYQYVKDTTKRNMSSAVCALLMHKFLAPTPIYMQSFALVVFAWKFRLFCLWAHGQCHVYYVYQVEFHFRFRRMVSFPVKHQLWSGCHSEKSSKNISGNFSMGGEGARCFWGMGQFLRLSSIFRSASF